MSLIQNGEILVKVGARGELSNYLDDEWDEVCYGNVKQILLSHGDAIDSIQMAYETKGSLIFSHKHGGNGDKFDNINFESWENITFVKGFYGPVTGNKATVIRSLAFGTARSTYGPFGQEEGTPFCFNIRFGLSFAGFHGRSNSSYLSAIGIYVKTMAKYHYLPNPIRYKTSPSISVASDDSSTRK